MSAREPFYHDFSRLGLLRDQFPPHLSGGQPLSEGHLSHRRNQQAKEPIITAYILTAMAGLRSRGEPKISFAELFCADGYYALFARKFGADSACGFDNDRDGFLVNAGIARDLIGLDNVKFHQMDVHQIPEDSRFSIVANIGGLYHVSDPVDVLLKSVRMAERYLIVQTAVSLATTDENYFETPAPGWTWGCRFGRQSFEKLIRDLGLCVIDSAFNHLTGNTRLEDLGSVYYLIDTGTRSSEHPKPFTASGIGSDFDLLAAVGLRASHSVLDYDCACPVTGQLLRSYLEAGNYYAAQNNVACQQSGRSPFDRTFDYILVESAFTRCDREQATTLCRTLARSLAPYGLAVAAFRESDDRAIDTGEAIRNMAAAAGLDAQRFDWHTPGVTWYLLSRPGRVAVEGWRPNPIRLGFPRPSPEIGWGFIDDVEVHGPLLLVQGWALDARTKQAPLTVAAFHRGAALQILAHTAVVRPDVSQALNLAEAALAGFSARFSCYAELDLQKLIFFAIFPAGAVELQPAKPLPMPDVSTDTKTTQCNKTRTNEPPPR